MKQEKQKEDICRAVLLSVQAHSGIMGVDALALVLKGSRSKKLVARKLHESRFFGSLFYHTTDVISNFIKQCLQLGFLTTIDLGVTSYPTPVLVLTDTGRKLLEGKEIIPLLKVRSEKENEPKLTPAIEDACSFMKQLGSVDEVAKLKGIAVSTVYDYLSKGIELGVIDIDCVIANELQKQISVIAANSHKRFKEIKCRLPEAVSYGEIRCVIADMIRKEKSGNTF